MIKSLLRPVMVLILVSVIGFVLIKALPHWQLWQNADWLKTTMEAASLSHWLWLVLVLTSLMVVGFPRQAVSFGCGMLLGAFQGTVLALAVGLCGAVITYVLANQFGRLARRRLSQRRLQRFGQWLSQAPFRKILFVRLLPVGSNLLTNIVAGTARIPLGAFVGASALGYLPQTLIFALAGQGVVIGSATQMMVSIGLMMTALVIGGLLMRTQQKDRMPSEVLDAKR